MIRALLTLLTIGGLGTFVHGMLTPADPYVVGYGPHQKRLYRRLTVEIWAGGLAFVVGLAALVLA